MSECTAGIRPLPNDTEIRCEVDLAGPHEHSGVLRNYAYPGSKTTIWWLDSDRRTFHGDWPGLCELGPCTLPLGHHGRCAR